LNQMVTWLAQRYPTNGPEGGMTITSYYPQSDFVHSGNMRFEDGIQNDALFWTVEHGTGCVGGDPQKWCVTVLVKSHASENQMVQLLKTQPPPPAATLMSTIPPSGHGPMVMQQSQSPHMPLLGGTPPSSFEGMPMTPSSAHVLL